ncbi:hypothetical protein [Chryseobacterium sp. CCH4-E10]|uniref:hypothetical protein n=1 Tax=Chryseobacterium sp. CCH4-E10 TaxID=1768758 RepID=UPI0008341D04|nr:hypothetical protein [Chryseobacterium sp. CCH4-E10]
MNTIITNTIEQNKIAIDFNFQDGALSFPSVEINLEGDIDFNTLIEKLIELLEHKRTLEFEFVDTADLAKSTPKIALIQKTITDIYVEFNKKIEAEKLELNENISEGDYTDTQA